MKNSIYSFNLGRIGYGCVVVAYNILIFTFVWIHSNRINNLLKMYSLPVQVKLKFLLSIVCQM